MSTIGAEVGQKMRSAIKAKLLELNCYVDDELPDYVMVMVANKRTKSQMKEDLQLFLATKTSAFVDWLHIVLKKLKEVTVTNPDVYKKSTKRKIIEESDDVKVKKEKKDKKKLKKIDESDYKSLTDDLPINANKLAEQRKIVVMKENKFVTKEPSFEDNFDIPLLSEVNMSSEKELEDIEKKIKNVKSRLGLLIESDSEDNLMLVKNEKENPNINSEKHLEAPKRKIQIFEKSNSNKTVSNSKHTRITFDKEDTEDENKNKRKSVLHRLGKRRSSNEKSKNNKIASKKSEEIISSPKKVNKSKHPDKKRESALNRLGVLSKVSIPQKKDAEDTDEIIKNREVASMVKVKPRIIPVDAPQANKSLLLKAVAEAQRSIAQTPTVGNHLKPDALYTKKYKEKIGEKSRKLQDSEKNKLKNLIESSNKNKSDVDDDDSNYVPKSKFTPKYKHKSNSSTSTNSDTENEDLETEKNQQQFIITLDGIEKSNKTDEGDKKSSIKSRLDKRKLPSPIIFDKISSPIKIKTNIPDKLPLVHAPPSIKNKERCKYWPGCRQGDKCEFVHPSTNCEIFPNCKFGDKCLYLHPSCKFGSSCTRRNCPYVHLPTNKLNVIRNATSAPAQVLQTCKFFPNCTNLNCAFFHPKPCKFGKFCKNQADCTFSHNFIANKSSLTWRPK